MKKKNIVIVLWIFLICFTSVGSIYIFVTSTVPLYKSYQSNIKKTDSLKKVKEIVLIERDSLINVLIIQDSIRSEMIDQYKILSKFTSRDRYRLKLIVNSVFLTALSIGIDSHNHLKENDWIYINSSRNLLRVNMIIDKEFK